VIQYIEKVFKRPKIFHMICIHKTLLKLISPRHDKGADTRKELNLQLINIFALFFR